MVVQGMLLPLVIRWAKIPVDTTEEDEINEAIRTIIAESFDSVADDRARKLVHHSGLSTALPTNRCTTRVYTATCTLLRKDGANAPEEARRIIEAGDLEKELRLRHLEKQRSVLKRLRNERIIDTNVLHAIQEILDIEEVRVLGPVELE